jgi:hypothetical protein
VNSKENQVGWKKIGNPKKGHSLVFFLVARFLWADNVDVRFLTFVIGWKIIVIFVTFGSKMVHTCVCEGCSNKFVVLKGLGIVNKAFEKMVVE